MSTAFSGSEIGAHHPEFGQNPVHDASTQDVLRVIVNDDELFIQAVLGTLRGVNGFSKEDVKNAIRAVQWAD